MPRKGRHRVDGDGRGPDSAAIVAFHLLWTPTSVRQPQRMEDLVVRVRDGGEIVEPVGHLARIGGEMHPEGAEFAGVGERGSCLVVREKCVAVGVGDSERVDVGDVVGRPLPRGITVVVGS